MGPAGPVAPRGPLRAHAILYSDRRQRARAETMRGLPVRLFTQAKIGLGAILAPSPHHACVRPPLAVPPGLGKVSKAAPSSRARSVARAADRFERTTLVFPATADLLRTHRKCAGFLGGRRLVRRGSQVLQLALVLEADLRGPERGSDAAGAGRRARRGLGRGKRAVADLCSELLVGFAKRHAGLDQCFRGIRREEQRICAGGGQPPTVE